MEKVLITGGIHGDEIGGVFLAHEIKGWAEGMGLKNVEVVPEVNMRAIEKRRRGHPEDGKDLNRVFPGDSEGSESERMAYGLFERALGFDLVVDLHTYGKRTWCLPYILTDLEKEFNVDLAERIGLDYAVQTSGEPGQLFIELIEQGIPACIIEFGGAEFLERRYFEAVKRGLINLLTEGDKEEVKLFHNYGRISSDLSGEFKALSSPGDEIEVGEVIGRVDEEEVRSTLGGLVLGVRKDGPYEPEDGYLIAVAEEE